MNEGKMTEVFQKKFNQLTLHNQRYIFAIQQALMYAQENEQSAKDKSSENELKDIEQTA